MFYKLLKSNTFLLALTVSQTSTFNKQWDT